MSKLYDLHSRPPVVVLVTSAFQHMGLMAVTLVFPLLVANAAAADDITRSHYVALAMVAMGVATLLQVWGKPILGAYRVGSGFLLPAVFTAAYLPAALATAQSSGLGAVAGMTLVAGLSEIVLSRFIVRLRPYLPIEIVGLVVLSIGMILGIVALKLIVGYSGSGSLSFDGTGSALVALFVMIGFTVWGAAGVRNLAVLIGLIAGVAFHILFDMHDLAEKPDGAVWFSFPTWPLAIPSFEMGLLPGFLAGSISCTLRAFGDIVVSQRANNREWKRPDYVSIQAGILGDGIGTVAAGMIGTMGLNTYSASVGLSVATEVFSRRVGLVIGFGWIALGLLPGSARLLFAIPENVLAAALLFASAFIVLSGISILGQRMVDRRRTIAVGLGFLAGLSFDQFPAVYAQYLPPALFSVLNSSLVLALFTALALNALFRIGSHQSYELIWHPADGSAQLKQFLLDSGAHAGARTDAVDRLVLAGEEFSEAAPSLSSSSAISVSARFDEYALTLSFAWTGRPLRPGPPPSLEPDADDQAAIDGIVLILIRRLADRVSQREGPNGRQELIFRVEQ
ncbi:solute carrier family 23 protein [Aquabacter sp. CN5-332]|uniref:uracil-xanthine permease family protein n=1 Tax=Aquabacter sp. CN5-332 TaxID=3156608 RepID=UPI0032B395AA